MQFVPTVQGQVHFLVPFLMQIFVCGSWDIASQLE